MIEDIYSANKSDHAREILDGGLFSDTRETVIGRIAEEMKWRSDTLTITVKLKWDVKPGRMNQRPDDVKVWTD